MPNGAKNWCFTLNNFTDNELEQIRQLDNIAYLVIGKERGAEGTPHLQGYISFKSKRSLKSIKDATTNRMHLEIMRGTPEQASDYCKKDGDFEEHGTLPQGRGTRTDIQHLHKRLREGATLDVIREEAFGLYLKYHKAIEKYAAAHQRARDWKTKVIVYHGNTGTGKTRSVWDFHKKEDIYCHTSERWFDGYTGQKIALFDDFNGSEFKLSYLLRLLDRYPMRVPIKGDYVQWAPEVIYITSNKNPTEWYTNAHDKHRAALMRRIDIIKEFI